MKHSLLLFGEFLVNEGVITRDQLGEALLEQIHGNFKSNHIDVDPSSRKRIGEVIIHLGFLTGKELDRQLARYNEAIATNA